MRRLRIYAISTLAALACASVVLWIATRIEMRQAEQDMARMRQHIERLSQTQDFAGGFVGGVAYGPGIFTVFLAVLVSALVFFFLFRWQNR